MAGQPRTNSDDAAAQYSFVAQFGFRVRNMVISPLMRKSYVSHLPTDHSAIIKFVESRFLGSLTHLTNRDAAQPAHADGAKGAAHRPTQPDKRLAWLLAAPFCLRLQRPGLNDDVIRTADRVRRTGCFVISRRSDGKDVQLSGQLADCIQMVVVVPEHLVDRFLGQQACVARAPLK